MLVATFFRSTSPTFQPSEISHVSRYYFVTFTLQPSHEQINHTKLINMYVYTYWLSNVRPINRSKSVGVDGGREIDDVWKVWERKKEGELTATRVLRASIRIVAGQASGEAVGSKLLDRFTFVDPRLLHGYLPFSLEPGIRQAIRFSRFYVHFSRSVPQFRWHGSSADLLKIFYIVYICVCVCILCEYIFIDSWKLLTVN